MPVPVPDPGREDWKRRERMARIPHTCRGCLIRKSALPAAFLDADGTLMKDEFHFLAPFGILGRISEAIFLTGYLRRFLAKRAAELKNMAESDEWRHYLTD